MTIRRKKQNNIARRVLAWRALTSEHAVLDAQLSTLTDMARAGDWRQVDAEWETFTQASGPYEKSEADALRAEHVGLRTLMESIGIAIQTHHRFAMTDVVVFMDRLRSHAKREDQIFYPWLKAKGEVEQQSAQQ